MKSKIKTIIIFASVLILANTCFAEGVVKLSPNVTLCQNSINGVFIKQNGHALVIYGDPGGNVEKADKVFFTHNRRDVIWAGRELVDRGAEAVVPVKEADSFSKAEDFWASFTKARFGDYQ